MKTKQGHLCPQVSVSSHSGHVRAWLNRLQSLSIIVPRIFFFLYFIFTLLAFLAKWITSQSSLIKCGSKYKGMF